MKLETIVVSGFRSIESTVLAECGGFNVVIGKNNAGKSNILLAINAFFTYVRGGEPVFMFPAGTVADHYERKTSTPIEICLGFELSTDERAVLLQDVVAHAPQIKNAIDTLNPDLRLRVRITILTSTRSFAFVRQLALCTQEECKALDQGTGRVLLEIGDSAAEELATRSAQISAKRSEVKGFNQIIENISRFDSDDWARLKAEPPSRFYRVYGRFDALPNAESQAKIEAIFRGAETLPAAKEALQNASAAEKRDVELLAEKSLQNRIASISGEESSVPSYATKLIQRLGEKKVLYLTERREPIGRREAARLLELKVKRGGPEKLRNIQETVEALLGVEIDAFQAEGPREPGNQAAELDVDRFLVQANGAGIREALRLILDYEFEKPSLLLVEEPEIHLHPALETSMMRYLKGIPECQVFITTHSTNFLDTAEMRNVYLALRDPPLPSSLNPTRVQLLSAAEAESSIPRELGIRLSSLFMFDRLVFVEGPSDEDVIREWAALLGVNLAQRGVGFVPMGGARNLAHFAAESTIRFLSKRQVKLWFVLDRDERDDAEIRRLNEALTAQTKLIILSRREIENYLVVPSAIAKFIGLKRTLAGKPCTEPMVTEVQSAIEECAESLRETSLERRIIREICVPVFPDRNELLKREAGKTLLERIQVELDRQRARLDATGGLLSTKIDEHTKALDRDWTTRKTELVPGDTLLDDVCKKFGVRFNKERDSGRLASLMSGSDLGGEIARLIDEIGR